MSRPKLLGLAIVLGLGCLLVRCHTHASARDERRMCSGGPTYPITAEECERWTAPAAPPLPSGLVVRDASVDVGQADAADATDASEHASDATVAVTETVDAGRACRRKSGVSPSAPDQIEIGCTKAEVLAAEGEPGAKKGEVWTYRFPDHCSDTRVIVDVRFAKGRVVRVHREQRRTGEFCADPF